MSLIDSTIKNELSKGKKILSVFLTAGFPKLTGFEELVLQIFDAGADMIELGIPFSDPIADGPVIQNSSQIALENGVTIEKVFKVVDEIKKHCAKPIILMGYANPIQSYGLERFFSECRQLKVDGIIIPDIPLDEYDDFFSIKPDGTDTILLVSPTSDDDRIKQIGEKSKGFVYSVSVKGITGERNSVNDESIKYVQRVKSLLPEKNILVGFGISSPQAAKTFAQVSDGIIVGSAIIKSLMNETLSQTLEKIKSLKEAMRI